MNRTTAEGQKLARRAHARLLKRKELKKSSFDLIINATPVGMGNGKQSLLSEPEINARYVMDMVYDPVETRLLKLAKDKGAHTITGMEMFTNQAARQFEIWTGKPAPIIEMQSAVANALAAAAAAASQNGTGKPKKKNGKR